MKKFLSIILSLTLILSLTGCTTYKDSLSTEVESLKTEIAELEEYKASLESEIETIKEENGLETYVLTLQVKQSHLSLDLSEHFKDALNDLEFDIPVSKEFYDSVDKGDVLDDSFRMGSFIMKGSFGSWKVKVIDKYIE